LTSPPNVGATKNQRGRDSDGLEWKRFNGFENVPFQHTDHFIVMCRSVPVEFCSFTPTCNLMEVSFPPSCKLRCQKYGCISVNDLKKPSADSANASANPDIADALMPLYSRELACVSEIHAVTHTRVECLRFAVLGMNGKVQGPNTTLLVVPLYSWLLIAEELTTNYSCSEYTTDAVTSSDRALLEKMERDEGLGKKYMTSKTATDELRVALQGFGVGGGLRQYQDEDEVDIPDASRGMLCRDLKTRKLMDEVEKRFASGSMVNKTYIKDDAKDPRHGKRSKAITSVDDRKLTASEAEAERKATISALIEARARVISLNDDLCSQELGLNASGGTSRYEESKNESKPERMTGNSSNGVGRMRVEVLEALQTIPNIKNIKMEINSTRKASKGQSRITHHQSTRLIKESAADRRQNRIILPYLRNKLDLIDDIIFQTDNR
jgi:hypothetical protein